MTTIAYRNGIIAADTGMTRGCTRTGFIEKIAKRKDGAVVGCCGNAWWMDAFVRWFNEGGEQPHEPDDGCSVAVVISKRRVLTIYESEKGKTQSYDIKVPYYSIGSGSQIALGAMHAGAHPVDAVKAAIAHNDGTYGRVQSLKVGW